MIKKILIAAGLAVALASSQAADKALVGAFDVGPGGLQGNFNPLAATAGFTWLSKYYEPLIAYDQTLDGLVGVLAQSYGVSPDQLTYTFKLADAKWHDGRPFSAKDVRFTLGLAANSKSGSVFAARLENLEKVELPNDKTVVLRLRKPTASFLDTLSKIMMLPEHSLGGIAVQDLPKNAYWSSQPVGTGPFKWGRYVTDQYVELQAFEGYRGGAPAVPRLINRFFANSAAAVAALRAGEIQFSYVEANDVATFAGNKDFRVIEGDSYVVNYLGFNQLTPLWKDGRVRQAVMHAINRDAIIKSLYNGAAKPAHCVYTAARLQPKELNPYAYDPDKARKLLAEAGWDKINGKKPITVLTYYNNPLATNTLAAIQAMLAQVGIQIVPRAVDTPTYNATVMGSNPKPDDFAMVYAGLQNGPDASNINIGLNAKQVPPAGTNIMRVDMPAVTDALDKALAEPDPARREREFANVCRATNAELPWATLWVAKRYGVASAKLDRFVWLPAPGGGPYADEAQKWSWK